MMEKNKKYLGRFELVRERQLYFLPHLGVVGISKAERFRLPLPVRLQRVVLQEGEPSHHALRGTPENMTPASAVGAAAAAAVGKTNKEMRVALKMVERRSRGHSGYRNSEQRDRVALTMVRSEGAAAKLV